MNIKRSMSCAASATALMASVAVAAAADDGGTTSEDSLQEVVVTARLRPESVQDVGQSITVISGDQLVARGIESFSDLVATTPGLDALDRGPGRSAPSIRGVSQSVPPQDILQQGITVGQFYDDVPTNSLTASQFSVPLYDLSRVEVLKGPQPTYFGEGSIGGSIRYFSRDPNLTQPEGQVRAELAYTDYSHDPSPIVTASLGGPLVEDELGARLTAWDRRDAGFIDNVTTGRDGVNTTQSSGAGAVVLFHPGLNFDWRLSVLYQDTVLGADQIVDSLSGTPVIGSVEPETSDPRTDDQTRLISNKIGLTLGKVRIESVFGYFDRAFDRTLLDRDQSFYVLPVIFGIPTASVTGFTDAKDENLSHDLRLITSFDGFINFVGGYYYADTSTHITEEFVSPQLVPIAGNDFYYNGDINVKGLQNALYGEAQLSFLDHRWRINAGARYLDLKQNTRFLGGINLPIGGGQVALFNYAALAGTDTFKQDATATLPRLQSEYDLTKDVMIYISASEGLRNGNVNSPAVIAVGGIDPARYGTYGPDSAWAYESGIKTSWLDRRLTANAALSFTHWDHIQTSVDVAGSGLIENGPEATIRNAEAEVSYRPTARISMYLSGDYTDAEYAHAFNLQVPQVPGGPILAAGDRLPLVPTYKLSYGGEYRAIGTLTFADPVFRLSVQNIGSMVNDAASQRPLSALTLINLQAGLEGRQWSGKLYVDNLANKVNTIYDASVYSSDRSLLTQYYINKPRTAGLAVWYKF
jgi:iron complex outermembrane recepter protein